MENVNLNELTVEQLDELMTGIRAEKKNRKAEAKEAEKAKKAELMEANKVQLQEHAEGETVRFILKGEETEGTLVKVTDKRFVVVHNEIKKAVMFDKLVEIVG